MRPAAAMLAAAGLLAASCGTEEKPPAKSGEPVSIGAPAPAPPPAPAGGGIAADRFRPPEGWQPEKPASAMRLLQYRLPRADGDSKDGEVAVFGSPMGGATANIERWRGQFAEVAGGKDSLEEIAAGEKGKVHLLDITGKYSGGMAPGGAAEAAAESRMIAAVMEIPAGTCYVKAIGPPATMGKWERSIREFILEAANK